MAQTSVSRPGGCLRYIFIGVGCGCVYPVAMLILVAALGWFFLAEPFQLLTRPPQLPEFAGPAQEDFWKLQEKRLDLENIASASLVLTPSEFNALLNAWQIPPVEGFCLQKARFVAGNENGTFYLIGSGYLMRNLVLSVDITRAQGALRTGKIMINSWEVPATGMVRSRVEKFLMALLEADPASLPCRSFKGEAAFDFSTDRISISGKF